ncbi:MAG: hypothetical protein K5984_03810 [Bacteroidales bacterium]|nr:hypothetical protein [Bacteroidales bacterium]
MMKTRFLTILAAVLAPALLAFGEGKVIHSENSFLRQLQKRDSVLIFDQLQYGFSMKDIPSGTTLQLPEIKDTLMRDVLLVRGWKIDTTNYVKPGKNREAKVDIEASVIITSGVEGRYLLPALAAVRTLPDKEADTLVFLAKALDVKTMPVDTTTYQIHDIKGQIRYPLTFAEVLPYILGFDLLAILVIVIVCLVMIHRKKVSAAPVPDEPAHITALRKLDSFRGDKFWAPEKQKTFYSGVTDAVREYISKRYEIDAMEMTTAEIFSDLKKTDVPADLYEEMKDLFERADFIKFAKHTATDEENSTVIPSAVRFVTTTYQSQLDTEADSAEQNK